MTISTATNVEVTSRSTTARFQDIDVYVKMAKNVAMAGNSNAVICNTNMAIPSGIKRLENEE